MDLFIRVVKVASSLVTIYKNGVIVAKEVQKWREPAEEEEEGE